MPIEKITSRKSSVVKNAAALLQKAENRSEAGLFMAEGARLCADAARSQTEIAACFFTENAAKKYKDYLDPVLKQTEHAYCIEEHIAPMLSDTKNPQGIFCVCRMPKRRADGLPVSAESDTRPCRHVLVMENIQDPSNMGNVLRTAEALGVRHLALVGACCDVYAPKVLRGSMGAVFGDLRVTLVKDCLMRTMRQYLSEVFAQHEILTQSEVRSKTEYILELFRTEGYIDTYDGLLVYPDGTDCRLCRVDFRFRVTSPMQSILLSAQVAV